MVSEGAYVGTDVGTEEPGREVTVGIDSVPFVPVGSEEVGTDTVGIDVGGVVVETSVPL